MTSYKLSTTSYLLLLLHAQKYVHSLTGLLLGNSCNDTITITQILPLAHSDLTLYTTPVTETGLHLSEHYALSKGLSIVGVYYSNDVIADTGLPTHVVRLADRLRERFSRACIMRIDGEKLEPRIRAREHCLVVHRGDSWKEPADAIVEMSTFGLVDKALAVNGVADLEDHLLDPRADWLNVDVLQTLEAL